MGTSSVSRAAQTPADLLSVGDLLPLDSTDVAQHYVHAGQDVIGYQEVQHDYSGPPKAVDTLAIVLRAESSWQWVECCRAAEAVQF